MIIDRKCDALVYVSSFKLDERILELKLPTISKVRNSKKLSYNFIFRRTSFITGADLVNVQQIMRAETSGLSRVI